MLGPAGAGKSAAAKKVAYRLHKGLFPSNYKDRLENSIVISTTPAKISIPKMTPQQSVEKFFATVISLEKTLGMPIVVFIDEFHSFDNAQLEALKIIMENDRSPVRLFFASTDIEYQNRVKFNPALSRRIKEISVIEQSIDEVYEELNKTWRPKLESKRRVKISDEAAYTIVQQAKKLRPSDSRMDTARKIIDDITNIAEEQNLPIIDRSFVIQYLKDELQLPFDPENIHEMDAFFADKKKQIKEIIFDQDRMIDQTMDLVQSMFLDEKRSIRSAVIMGKTGSAKSLLTGTVATMLFKNSKAILHLDGNNFQGKDQINAAFGAANGYLSSDVTAGSLHDWLAGDGKFGGVIAIDEIERADPKFTQRLMEFIENGASRGGNGKTYYARNILVLFTSNQSIDTLLPKGSEKWNRDELVRFLDKYSSDQLKNEYLAGLNPADRNALLPVFGRVDLVTSSNPVDLNNAVTIALASVRRELAAAKDRWGIQAEMSPDVVRAVVEKYFAAEFGYRSVRPHLDQLMLEWTQIIARSNLLGKGTDGKIVFSKDGKIVLKSAKGELPLPFSAKIKLDPLDDPKFLKLSKELKPALQSVTMGNEDAVAEISREVLSFLSIADNRTSAKVIYLTGEAGSGKNTRVQKVAEMLTGSKDRAVKIPLGDILNADIFFKIFGEHLEKQKPGAFEEALQANPDGGVLLFHRMSDLMAGNAKEKKILSKWLFDNVLKKKTWKSPSTGRPYDLSKYIFFISGTEVGQIYSKQLDDYSKHRIYELMKEEKSVFNILETSGISSDLLSNAALVLSEPTYLSKLILFAKEYIAELEKEFVPRGLKLKLDDKFLEKFSELFFDPDQGPVSLKSVVNNQLRSVMNEAFLKGITGEFELNVSDSYADKIPDVFAMKPREVMMTLSKDSNVSEKLDLTFVAVPKHLYTKKVVHEVRVHEAGHAVMNIPELTGQIVDFVTVTPKGGYLGYMMPKRLPVYLTSLNHKVLIARVARLLAGGIAQKLSGFDYDTGWSSDHEMTRDLIKKALIDGRLDLDLAALPDGKALLELFDKKFPEVYKEAFDFARAYLIENWDLIRAVTLFLAKHENMTRSDFDMLRKNRSSQKWEYNGTRMVRVAEPTQHLSCEALFMKAL